MGKQRKKRPTSTTGGRPTGLLVGAVALALVAAAATWLWLGRHDPLSAAPAYAGGPRLAADTDNLDFGTVRFNRMVTATFQLRNVGDAPLTIAANPAVETVEGC